MGTAHRTGRLRKSPARIRRVPHCTAVTHLQRPRRPVEHRRPGRRARAGAITEMAERYGETPDSAVATELFACRAVAHSRPARARPGDRPCSRRWADPAVSSRARQILNGRRAHLGESAHVALGLARLADLAAVLDEAQREVTPLLGRYQPVQIVFDLHRIRLVRELETMRQPRDVRVDRQARLAEPHRAHDVAGLAADAREV